LFPNPGGICRKNCKFCERISNGDFPSELLSQKYLAKERSFARIFAKFNDQDEEYFVVS